jgi:predicted Rossmann fold nucleotide-binding protein DprA/Smf involved in DNA uptake
MTAREQGFLLLTGYLGDPECRPLTVAQFRNLTLRAQKMQKPEQDRAMTAADIIAMGYDRAFACRVIDLLSRTEQLQWYLQQGVCCGCMPITRVSQLYPHRLRKRLGPEATGVIWAKGNLSLLQRNAVALVGSRDLCHENREFARLVGKCAALQGYTLVSGHARGADRTAQDSCLKNGGSVISVVADELEKYTASENILYLSEEGFDLGFSTQRALQRNRLIHCLGDKTFVAQCTLGRGGTWSGTTGNLHHGWSPVFCFRDGSEPSRELEQLGAVLIEYDQLNDIAGLQTAEISFIDQ